MARVKFIELGSQFTSAACTPPSWMPRAGSLFDSQLTSTTSTYPANTIDVRRPLTRTTDVVFVVLLLLTAACDSSRPCEPVYDLLRQNVGVVATTGGEVIRTFPLLSPGADLQNIRAEDVRLELLDEDVVLVKTPYFARIFELSSGAPLVSLAFEPQYAARGRSLYFAATDIGWYEYAPNLQTPNRALSSTVERVTIAPSGDTTRSILFETSIERSEGRFEAVRYLAAIPQSNNSVLYVREREITTVTTDSLQTEAYFDRYYFERSLWRFDAGSHEKIMTLPEPFEEGQIEHFDYTPDGRYLVYEDRDLIYFIDVVNRSVRTLNEPTDPLWHPVVSDDGEYVLALQYSCGQTYRMIDVSTGETWTSLATRYCSSHTAAFSPDGSAVFFGDTRNDSIAVWMQDVADRLWDDGSPPSVVFLANGVIPIRRDYHAGAVSAPLFLGGDMIFIVHSYSGSLDECE